MPSILIFLLFQISFIAWIFILSLRYYLVLIYSYLTHWAVELTLPQTDILQVAWRQGSGLCCAGFVLYQSNSCILERLDFLNDTCGSWDRLLILYIYRFGEPCSSFISSWHSRYLVLGCSNNMYIYQHDAMWSWKLSFLRLYGWIERNSRIHIDMFLHK